MEIQECVAEVVNGLFEAITELQQKHCAGNLINQSIVCPSDMDLNSNTCHYNGETYVVSKIHFDVALTVVESEDKEKEVKATLKLFGGKVSSGSDNSNSIVQRVSFDVPVVYPSISTRSRPESAGGASGIY